MKAVHNNSTPISCEEEEELFDLITEIFIQNLFNDAETICSHTPQPNRNKTPRIFKSSDENEGTAKII